MKKTVPADVLIVGGGAAGVAAAVAASGRGLKVVLIERNFFLGGKATAAQVGTVCGLYQFSKSAKATYIVKGFAKSFADELKKRSHSTPLSNQSGLHYLPYDIEAFKNICLELMAAAKVELYFNSILKKVEVVHDKISSVTIECGPALQEITLKTIIDCTGEGMVSSLANLPLIKSDCYQAAAQVFTLQNLGECTEAALGMLLKKTLQAAIDSNKLEPYFDRVYIVQGSCKQHCVSLKIGIPLTVTHTPENLLELKRKAHVFIHRLTSFLVEEVAIFKHASLLSIAPEVGVRVGLRSSGKYTLTREDVITCKKTSDAIANASWPIEEWEQNKRVKMQYFPLDNFYHIPAGCLQSCTIKNLFMAGRNISATDSAIASARVMGTCLQTGYAAGCMAAAPLLNISEAAIIKIIQTEQL